MSSLQFLSTRRPACKPAAGGSILDWHLSQTPWPYSAWFGCVGGSGVGVLLSLAPSAPVFCCVCLFQSLFAVSSLSFSLSASTPALSFVPLFDTTPLFFPGSGCCSAPGYSYTVGSLVFFLALRLVVLAHLSGTACLWLRCCLLRHAFCIWGVVVAGVCYARVGTGCWSQHMELYRGALAGPCTD